MNDRRAELDSTRASWDRATQLHNAHKGDQAALLRAGTELLFPDELELLGPLAGQHLVHLQCNAGQDSLCLARHGARVTGVDFSSEASAFARQLSATTGIAARFVESELMAYFAATEDRFAIAFASYGVLGWHPDVAAWMRGARRILAPGGRLVIVEIHPLVWSLGPDLALSGDDYFFRGPYVAPVSDYVGSSGPSLGAAPEAAPATNDLPAYGFQHGLGEIVEAVVGAGFALEALRELPYANGFRPGPRFVAAPGRRWVWPPEVKGRIPLLFALAARAPA